MKNESRLSIPPHNNHALSFRFFSHKEISMLFKEIAISETGAYDYPNSGDETKAHQECLK